MTEETTTRLYELGYLITPTTPEGEVEGVVAELQKAIEKVEGSISSTGNPEFIDLAYTMEKNVGSKKMKWDQGYFGWMKFTAEPSALEALKKALDASKSLIRYILIKTNVENTIVFKKPKVDAKREVFMSDEELAELEQAAQEEPMDDVQEEHERLPELEVESEGESTPTQE